MVKKMSNLSLKSTRVMFQLRAVGEIANDDDVLGEDDLIIY